MTIYTIGFTQKTAEQFFRLIKDNSINIVLDIRLNNKSQLSGFTKGDDLQYFLSKICQCEYKHCLEYAPTKNILDDYRKKHVTWDEYVKLYTALINERAHYHDFVHEFFKYDNICFLCSEPTSEHCHRRLLAKMIIQNNIQVNLKHI